MTKVKFKDSLIIEPSLNQAYKKDASDILNKDKNPRLLVEIDATHSGVIINNRVYPGKSVRDAYKSFFSKERGGSADFDKPILKHHNSYDDAIGRIVNARFSQLKNGSEFDFDYLSPAQSGSKGSGIVTITGIITDVESIAKILDTRYLSVSAGHSSEIMLCSTCGDSLFSCDHMPGIKYNDEGERSEEDGKVCYAITGDMTYHECSFVNIPASPPAKLVNFSWTDSKEKWSKDSIITTQITGKKESVRNFVLSDEDGELSLLTGRHQDANKKTVIAVSPAVADKLKHVMSSELPGKGDEASNVRHKEPGSDLGVPNVEQNLGKAKLDLDATSKQEKNMDLEKKIADLETEIKGLKDNLATAQKEASDTKKLNEGKDSQIQRLTADATAMQTKMSKTLAVSLASLKSRLKKLDGLETKEKFDAYVEKLSTRSVDSLQDSLQDFMLELDTIKVEDKPDATTKATADVIAKDKLNSNVLSKGGKPDNKVTKKSGENSDTLTKVIGI